jgi:glutamate carboxypeptidase
MSGGEKRNTVAGCADAYIDMRFPNEESGNELLKKITAIASEKTIHNSRYPRFPKIESWAVLHRPAKQVNRVVDTIISEAMGLSQLIGEPIVGTRYSGGGTDGSIAQAVGLPTMDSLGLDGAGAHSSRELSSVKSLIARTKLAAVLIARHLHREP